MALRSLDNALPKTPEIQKKQVKVVASIPKQPNPDLGVNDENKAPLSQDATIDYVSSENLKPIADPESRVQVRLHV